METTKFSEWLKNKTKLFDKVVPFNGDTDRLLKLDFTNANIDL